MAALRWHQPWASSSSWQRGGDGSHGPLSPLGDHWINATARICQSLDKAVDGATVSVGAHSPIAVPTPDAQSSPIILRAGQQPEARLRQAVRLVS